MEYSFKQHRLSGGIGADDGYWEALERGEFRLARCADCKTWRWPAHFRCASCGSWEQEWEPVEPEGTVFTWTKTWMPFDRTSERAEDVPYVVIVAEIAQAGGARVIGALKGSEDGLRVGAKVRGSIDPPSAKSLHYAAIRWTLED